MGKRLLSCMLAIAMVFIMANTHAMAADRASVFVMFWNNDDAKTVSLFETKHVGDTVEDIVPADLIREGYTFDGWYLDNETFVNKWDLKTPVTGTNLFLFAKWIKSGISGGSVLTGPGSVSAGEAFDITYSLKDYSGEGLAQDITVSFDAGKLEFVGSSSLDEDFIIVDHKESAPGVIRFLSIFLDDLQTGPDGSLMKLSFKAKADAASGQADVKITNAVVADGAGAEHEVSGASHSIEIIGVEKLTLAELIEQAGTLHDNAVEGKQVGQYPAGSKAVLNTAIVAAQQVLNNPSSTLTDIEQAANQLRQAVKVFSDSVIVYIPGDYNDDDQLSVGDLAVMAKSYGKTSADPDWDLVKSGDMNGDNKIDIEDLVLVARMIIEW
ncbi:cohesin domain-containing protein [Paenibacillus sepulcri]|uniref:FIVAR domain-containing protein n=1 Tax=Paenibacillus sepulcri TaxID=359917 RepID=A0ABS7BWM1_9BACL|nr:FIVAR domain-containing protein [Paenibacillus sepulcri]